MIRWQELGACYGTYSPGDFDIWYPPDNPGGPHDGKGVTGEKERIAMAKAVCATCDVRQECLEWALKVRDEYGVLGGTTPGERKLLQ